MCYDKNTDFFTELYVKYYSDIYAYCLKKLHGKHDTAKDCTQNVFFAAFQNIDNLRTHENPAGWLYKTAANTVLLFFRQHRRERREVLFSELNFDLPSPDNFVVRIEEREIPVDICYSTVMRSLTDMEKLLHKIYYTNGCSVEDTAKRLGITNSTCRVRLCRLRKKVRSVLREIMDSA